jgi:hypothetical protein
LRRLLSTIKDKDTGISDVWLTSALTILFRFVLACATFLLLLAKGRHNVEELE